MNREEEEATRKKKNEKRINIYMYLNAAKKRERGKK